MADLPADTRRAWPGRPTGSGASGGRFAESSRVEAFSDGIFAVAITLLVLDLKAPAHRGTVLHDLLAQWPTYVAWNAVSTATW